jgi:hypothetical protein
MPVYFVTEGTRGTAVWRASDDATDVYLCGVDLQAYEDAQVRAHFATLVDAVANYFRRAHAAEAVDPASRLDGYPCATCESLEGQDLRSRVGQLSSAGEIPLSPGGLPLGCCKITVVGGFRGQSDAPRPAAARACENARQNWALRRAASLRTEGIRTEGIAAAFKWKERPSTLNRCGCKD